MCQARQSRQSRTSRVYSCRLGCLSSFDSESISWQKREQPWNHRTVRHIDISQRISHWSRIAASATSASNVFQDFSYTYVLYECCIYVLPYEMCGENLDGFVRFLCLVSFLFVSFRCVQHPIKKFFITSCIYDTWLPTDSAL